MSLISADSSREFLTLGSHAFSWGLSLAASGYIYDSPSNTPPPPTAPPTVILATWTQAYVDATFSKRYLGGSISSGRCHYGGITPSRHVLHRFNAGALISRVAVQLQRSTREDHHLLGLKVWKVIGGKKKNRCEVFVSGLILPELLTDPDGTWNGMKIGRRKDNGMW